MQRLTKLSTDLLDLSRVDAGQLSVLRRAGGSRIGREMLAGELEHVAASTEHGSRPTPSATVWCAGDEQRVLADRPCARRQRDRPHACRNAGDAAGRRTGRTRRAGRSRTTGPGIPPSQQGRRLRALLSRRGRDGLRKRPRPRDRAVSSHGSWAVTCGSSRWRGRPFSRSTFLATPRSERRAPFSRENASARPRMRGASAEQRSAARLRSRRARDARAS